MSLSFRTMKFVALVAGIVVAYLLLSPFVIAKLLVFQPLRVNTYEGVPKTTLGANGEEVVIPLSSGERLYGYFFEKPKSRFTVLLHHGQGGNLATHIGLAKTILLSGSSVLIYDYEGFGKSQGSPSNRNLLRDGEAAYDFLVNQKGIPANRIIQCGVSLGSGVASHVATVRPTTGVILISPYLFLRRVATERLPYLRAYPRALFPEPDLGSRTFIENNRSIPVLLIHGGQDQIINANHSRELQKLSTVPARLVIDEQARHGSFSTVFLADQIRAFTEQDIVLTGTSP